MEGNQFQQTQFPAAPEKKKFYKKWWFWLIIVVVVIAIIVSQGDGKTSEVSGDNTSRDAESSQDASPEADEQKYGLGDVVTIKDNNKDMYTLTINSVTLTDDRNQFSEKEPNQVVIINYSYDNIAKEGDLFISDWDFKVIDADRNVCESYPVSTANSPQSAPVGTKSSGDMAFGLESDGKTFTLTYYDNVFWDSAPVATFEITLD